MAGTALTFVIGGFIVERAGVKAVFVAAAATLLPAGVAWWIGVRDPIGAPPASSRTGGSLARAL